MPLERTIVAKVLDEARRLGWWAMKNHGNAYSVKGLPDVLVIKKGRAAWMEVKRPGEDPTRIQQHRIRERSTSDARPLSFAVWAMHESFWRP